MTQSDLVLDGCTVDIDRRLVRQRGQTIRLTSRESALLRYLVERPGEEVSREELLVDVWGYERSAVTRAVDKTMANLRGKIERERGQPRHLLTVHGHGYRFVPLQPFSTVESAADVPPVVAAPSRPVGTTVSAVPLVGRAETLAMLRTQRTQGPVVLHGPGGAGKTALARSLAATLQAEGEVRAVCWCDLSTCLQGSQVDARVSAVVGAERVSPGALRAETRVKLQSRLAGVLIVLDGVEQISDAILRWVDFLGKIPDVHVVLTSRHLLPMLALRHVTVGPLSLADAVALFLERARQRGVNADAIPEEMVRQIVEGVDCLPMSIELAAGRVGLLTPDALARRVVDEPDLLVRAGGLCPARLASITSSVEWSWSLLDAEARNILMQCGIFQGTFTVEAAEGIIVPVGPRPVLDGLQQLLNQSLLVREGGRLRLYSAVRAFVRARLAVSEAQPELEARYAR